MIGDSDVLIRRQSVIDALCKTMCNRTYCGMSCDEIKAIELLPNEKLSLYGYELEQLTIIATILHKEGLPPERVSEAITDVDRIIAMVRAEFEEQLRKTIEHLNTTMKGEQ